MAESILLPTILKVPRPWLVLSPNTLL